MQQPILCECGDSICGDVAYAFSLIKRAVVGERIGAATESSLRSGAATESSMRSGAATAATEKAAEKPKPAIEKINMIPASNWNIKLPMDAEMRAPLVFEAGEPYSMEFAYRALGVRKLCCKTRLNNYMDPFQI